MPVFQQKANKQLSNLNSTSINTSLISDTDSTDDLGSSSKYWSNGYIDKIYLNSSATIDGTSAGEITIASGITVTGTTTTNTSGNIKANNGFVYARGVFDESTTTAGIYMGYGPSNDSPRILLTDGTAARNWQIDNYWSGAVSQFRWFLPDTTHMKLDSSSGLQIKKITGLDNNANLPIIPLGTGYTIIGDAGTTSHSFNTNDDLLVSGRLEVDGAVYFDGTVNGITSSKVIAGIGLSILTVGTTEPSSPSTGDVWIDTN